MRIGMVLAAGFYPGDFRVDKEARALAARGHSVFIICRSRKGEKPFEKLEDAEIHIERMDYPKSLVKLSNVILGLTDFRYHLFWRRRITRFARKNRLDALHVHDLNPALVTGSVARRLDLPFIVDLHEDYPSQRVGLGGLANRVLFSARKFDRVQRRAINVADTVIIPSPRFVEVFQGRYPEIDPGKFICVPNYQDLESMEELADLSQGIGECARFEMTFIGSMGSPGRGVQVAIEAMPFLLETIPEARLVLVGDGPYVPELQRLTSRLGLDDAVEFTGQVSFEEATRYVSRSTVCIVPFVKDQVQFDLGCPHKLFQYMALRKPVLVSDCHEISRHVRDSGGGIVFRSGDPADLAEKACSMQSRELRAKMGAKGYSAVIERYNFERGARGLLALYDGLDR